MSNLKCDQAQTNLEAFRRENTGEKLFDESFVKYFRVGCSDCTKPESQSADLPQKQFLVHRNPANLVLPTDMNCLAAMQMAVEIQKAENIVVCGHYYCGGVKAAMGTKQNGLVDNWIRHIKDVYRLYEDELEAIEDETEKFHKFVEYNVYEQVFDLSKTSIIQNAWENRNEPKIHGWVFDIKKGLIKDLGITFDNQSQLPSLYKIDSTIVR